MAAPITLNGTNTYPQQILCDLQTIMAYLGISGTTPSNPTTPIVTKMADPFITQLVNISTTDITLTIPSTAEYCEISVKGDGELRQFFGATPTANASTSFYKDDIFKLENLLQMQKSHFISTSTNQLSITYYKLV